MESLISENKLTAPMRFIVVDDGSTDGTEDALKEFFDKLPRDAANVEVLRGDGNLFYSGGMRMGISRAKELIGEGSQSERSDNRVILLNDDVEFEPHILERVLALPNDRVYVGPMHDGQGNFSYGGTRYRGRSIHYDLIGPDDEDKSCDTFNANFVVLPEVVFMKAPNMDEAYIHSLGDFDYGLQIKRMGVKIEVLPFYAGTCPDNPTDGTWADTKLSRRERLKKKESPKGAPFKPWFHFLKKNFGLGTAIVRSMTPYIRILIGK